MRTVLPVLPSVAAMNAAATPLTTGLVVSDQAAWSRPVELTVMHDGSLLVSEDGDGTIWRITFRPAS